MPAIRPAPSGTECDMRNLIAGAFVSLDGVMQAPGGPEEDPTGGFDLGGWTTTYWDDVMDEAAGEIYGRPFDLLPGSKTYEIFAAPWPYSDEHPIHDHTPKERRVGNKCVNKCTTGWAA